MGRAMADDGQELVKLGTSGLSIGALILPPAIVETNEQSRDHEECGYPPSETCPVKLQPCSSCRLVNDLVVVGLTLVGCLICNRWGFATGTSHGVTVDVLAAARSRVIDLVTGQLAHGLGLELELGLELFGFAR